MTEKIQVRMLVNPTSGDLDRAAQTIAAAFADDGFTASCVGNDKSKILELERATVAAAVLGGELWVASYGDRDFACVAGWFGPGRYLLDSLDQKEAGFNALFASFPPDLTKWWSEYFLPKYNSMVTTALGEGIKVNNWHLQIIGTLPELHGKGLARAITQPVVEKAQAEGKILCLETNSATNVIKYKKLGWEDKHGPEHFESPHGSFPMWVMTKKP